MSVANELLIHLRGASRLQWSHESAPGMFDTPEGKLCAMASDWSALPDLLVEPTKRELVGLAFYFRDSSDPKLQHAGKSWLSDAYRIVPTESQECKERYPFRFPTGCYLEVVLSSGVKGTQELAQLDFSAFCWLFAEGRGLPLGGVVWSASDVALDFNVQLPNI